MNMGSFESFRRVDVYSLGLMMWETVRRCMTHEGVEDFALPFHDMVPPDPGFDDMHKVVCGDSYRPQIPARWHGDKVTTTPSLQDHFLFPSNSLRHLVSPSSPLLPRPLPTSLVLATI